MPLDVKEQRLAHASQQADDKTITAFQASCFKRPLWNGFCFSIGIYSGSLKVEYDAAVQG